MHEKEHVFLAVCNLVFVCVGYLSQAPGDLLVRRGGRERAERRPGPGHCYLQHLITAGGTGECGTTD